MKAKSMSTTLNLGFMMLMQYLMFAIWWVPLAAYLANLGLSVTQKSLILCSMALGSMASPLIGMIADRYFASEKVLAVSNLLSGLLLFLAATVVDPTWLFVIIIFTMFCYMPSWSLTSSIAMAHTSADQFPRIRVFGTIGWVASGLFGLVAGRYFHIEKFDGSSLPLVCGASVSIIAAVFNLFLPHTPPPAKGQKATILDTLGFRAVILLKDRNFSIFLLLSFLSVIPFSFYHVYGSEFLQSQHFKLITFTMNLGQVVEVFFMIVVTSIILKVGIKWALIFGLIALVARYLFFYLGTQTGDSGQDMFYISGVLVHGIIFGLLYVGGQVYTDKKAPKELRAQAQGLLAFVIWGVGFLIGTIVNGWMIGHFSSQVDGSTVYQWDRMFAITTVFSVVVLVLFIVFFRKEKQIV
jgi:nucleoside transporter